MLFLQLHRLFKEMFGNHREKFGWTCRPVAIEKGFPPALRPLLQVLNDRAPLVRKRCLPRFAAAAALLAIRKTWSQRDYGIQRTHCATTLPVSGITSQAAMPLVVVWLVAVH